MTFFTYSLVGGCVKFYKFTIDLVRGCYAGLYFLVRSF